MPGFIEVTSSYGDIYGRRAVVNVDHILYYTPDFSIGSTKIVLDCPDYMLKPHITDDTAYAMLYKMYVDESYDNIQKMIARACSNYREYGIMVPVCIDNVVNRNDSSDKVEEKGVCPY